MSSNSSVKLALVLSLLVLILAGAAILPANGQANPAAKTDKVSPAATAALQGRWTGKGEVDSKTVTFRLEFQSNGKEWRGVLSARPDEEHELFDIRLNGSKLSFECKADGTLFSFDAELKEDTASGTVEVLKKDGGVDEGKWSMTRKRK